MKQIMNDADYKKATDWLVDASIELADPLFDGPEREKKQTLYNHVTKLIQAYRRGELVQLHPGLRAVYAELGWPVTEVQPEQPEAVHPEEPAAIEPESKRAEVATPTSSYDWLDED